MSYYLIVIRGTFLKGVGLDVLWPQMPALAALGVALIGLSVRGSASHSIEVLDFRRDPGHAGASRAGKVRLGARRAAFRGGEGGVQR